MKTKYLGPICATLVGLAGSGFLEKANRENRNAHNLEGPPGVESVLSLRKERYPWKHELRLIREMSGEEFLQNLKYYQGLAMKIKDSEDQETLLLKNPVIRQEYSKYQKLRSMGVDKSYRHYAIGFGLLLPAMIRGVYFLKKNSK